MAVDRLRGSRARLPCEEGIAIAGCSICSWVIRPQTRSAVRGTPSRHQAADLVGRQPQPEQQAPGKEPPKEVVMEGKLSVLCKPGSAGGKAVGGFTLY